MSKEFGGLVAVNDVSIDIPTRSIVSIIGPNGAGKTTLFNMLTGLYKPTAGRIVFSGRDITRSRPDVITRLGVARTFQNIRLFGAMTALENVMVGRHSRMRAGLFGSILRAPWVRREERAVRGARGRDPVLRRPEVAGSSAGSASNLSYGDQRRVEIARALASDPKLLLLDEPTAGMNPQESRTLTDFMRKMRDDLELTILLIEHDMKVVMGVSERVTVLDHGEKIAEGPPAEVRAEPARDRGVPRKADLMALLEVEEIHAHYGAIEALRGVSLDVERGRGRDDDRIQWRRQVDHAALDLGPDAGQLGAGRVRWRGDHAAAGARDRQPRDRALARGTPLLPAHDRRARISIWGRFGGGTSTSPRTSIVCTTLFPRLKERERQKAGTMSGGEQQMLAIGRALMARPKLLMFDEPSMGIAPILVQRIYETIGEINRQGVAILLVEQNANYALELAKRGYVLETGQVVLSNASAQLRDDPEVQRAYLGT